MKPFWLRLILVCSFATTSWAADVKATRDDVCVRKFDNELPKGEEKLSRFLWNNFANKPEEQQFDSLTSLKWRQTVAEFELALVENAKREQLDFESLKKCFQELAKEQSRLARVPVGAYAAKQGKSAIWIIVLKWEARGIGGKPQLLSHVMIYAFDAKKLRKIGYVTCA